jgi:spore maturation protein CgeB
LFLERDQPWYAENRDLPQPPFGRTEIYHTVGELKLRFEPHVREADCVIVGSFVPEGKKIGEWISEEANGVTAFYDIDTPITLQKIAAGDCDYLSAELVSRYHLYLSFTGGPTLRLLESEYGSPMARALYCSVDPAIYFREKRRKKWTMGYLGTFSKDREAALNALLLAPATMWASGRFVVAGPQYPKKIRWPANVERIVHLNPSEHRAFYNSQRFTLNITRAAMIKAGYSPSVRLFEAAACGTPIISDDWPGIETIFTPGEELIIAKNANDVLHALRDLSNDAAREIGARARERVLAEHTSEQRATQLEQFIDAAASTDRVTNFKEAAIPQEVSP